jgi:hypothetical protein
MVGKFLKRSHLLILIVVLLLVACTDDLPEPEKPEGDPVPVAREFMQALYNGNISKCTDLASSSSRLSVQELCNANAAAGASIDLTNAKFEEKSRHDVNRATIRMTGSWTIRVEQDGESALRTYHSDVDGDVLIGMIYQEGTWRVEDLGEELRPTEVPSGDPLLAAREYMEAIYAGDMARCLELASRDNQEETESFCEQSVRLNSSIDLTNANFEVNAQGGNRMVVRMTGGWIISYDGEDGERKNDMFTSDAVGAILIDMVFENSQWRVDGFRTTAPAQ